MLVGVCRYLPPALTIIDGIVAMHGQGPIRGPSKSLGWLIGGIDPVACEVVCGRLVGIEPQQLPIIRAALQVDFGCSDWQQIEIVGEALPAAPCPDFEMAKLIPVKFSFGRVCHSMARQLLLLARELRPGKKRKKQPVGD